MVYGYVENNQLLEGPTHLPPSWRNISGLDKMSLEALIVVGWLPWKTVEGPGEIEVSRSVAIQPNEIIETITRRSFTPDELAQLEQQRIQQQNQQRRNAYAEEADPLFFKWQRGESTEQEWLDKVAEIKSRFPK
jgi:hypothetical protein